MSQEQVQYNFADAIKMASPAFIQSGKKKELEKINQQVEMLETEPVCLLVCGEFKRGKSTFVNALIGRNLCATDTDICTSVVSIIKYASKECVTRFYGDFANPKSQKITLDDLEKYTVGTAAEIDNTIYVEIGLPLDNLQEGLIIIDTPGVGGLDPRHATLTNFFIPKADIALFMTDVNEPMTTTELNYLKSKVLPYAKQTALIVNKADLRDAESVEEFRLDTIAKVASFTQTSEETIQALSVSAAAEAYPDNDLGESNFAALKAMISSLVSKHRSELKKALKATFLEHLNLVIAPLSAQLQQIEQPDVNQVTDLTNQKAEIDRKLSELKDPNSEFRIAINKEITIERERIVNYLNEASVILQSDTFNNILHSPNAKAQDGGRWMGRMLNDAIAEIGSNITLQLEKAFTTIAEMPQFEGMLKFELRGYNSNIVIRDVDTSVPLNKRITPLMSGAGICSIAGLVLGPIGYIAGFVVGGYVAYRNQRDAGAVHTEANLRQVYQPQLSGAISNLNTYVNTRFTEFQQEWVGLITERCKAYQTSLQESIANIQQVKQQITQAVNMRVQTQNKLKPLLSAKEIITNLPD